MFLLHAVVVAAEESSQQPLWLVVLALVLGSAVLVPFINAWLHRRRVTYGNGPRMDQRLNVRARLDQKGKQSSSVVSVRVVVVRGWPYRWMHRIWNEVNMKGGIVTSDDFVTGGPVTVEAGSPFVINGYAKHAQDVPVPWKPWKSMAIRDNYTQRELRLRVSVEGAGKRFPNYKRIETIDGLFENKP